MPAKITKRLRALQFTELAKPRFKRIVNKFIKDEIISTIESGRSPVNKGGTDPKGTSGKLRFQKYSDSYIEQMTGKAAYFTKNGKVIRAKVDQEDKELVSFLKETFGNKKQRPVNLKLSGKMLRSIKSRITKNGVFVWFADEKAKYHNKLGAGKSKVLRRMLPNGKKEEFNAGIRKKIVNAMVNAIKLSQK